MNHYLFFLGHQPHISTAEIEAVLVHTAVEPPRFHIGVGLHNSGIDGYQMELKNKNILKLSAKKSINPEELIGRLGGTVKIAEQIANTDDVRDAIINFLQTVQPEGKIQFSLNGQNSRELSLDIKKKLKKSGRSVRYIEIKNTATILHNNLIEKQGDFTLLDDEVYITRAIQPIEDFAERDFGRPGTDSKSGMLPPKLAKIMLNLAKVNKKTVLLDPFCGSGTVLMEGAVLGIEKMYGADISKKALEDTDKNLQWIKKSKKLFNLSYQLHACDVSKIDKYIEKNSIDTIVSEPLLGKPLRGTEDEKTLRAQANNLGELYISAFQAFQKILKKDGIIIFIIPSFAYKNNWITVDCAEKIAKIGFTSVPFSKDNKFLQYYRPGQKLARNIWRFKKL